MMLSKKQKVIIWSFVVITVILLGFEKGYRPEQVLVSRAGSTHLSYEDRGWNTVTLYGANVGREKSAVGGILYGIANQKYTLIVVLALVGAALVITSKKK